MEVVSGGCWTRGMTADLDHIDKETGDLERKLDYPEALNNFSRLDYI